MLILRRRRIIFNIEQGTARSTTETFTVSEIEISQHRDCEWVTINVVIECYRQRNRARAEFFRKIFWLVVHIHSDPDDGDVRRVSLRAHFDESTGNFFAGDNNIVRQFDRG